MNRYANDSESQQKGAIGLFVWTTRTWTCFFGYWFLCRRFHLIWRDACGKRFIFFALRSTWNYSHYMIMETFFAHIHGDRMQWHAAMHRMHIPKICTIVYSTGFAKIIWILYQHPWTALLHWQAVLTLPVFRMQKDLSSSRQSSLWRVGKMAWLTMLHCATFLHLICRIPPTSSRIGNSWQGKDEWLGSANPIFDHRGRMKHCHRSAIALVQSRTVYLPTSGDLLYVHLHWHLNAVTRQGK